MRSPMLKAFRQAAGAGLLGLALVGNVQAQQKEAGDGSAATQRDITATGRATVSTTFTYQGKLEENGQAINGSRQMDFALSRSSGCGTLATGVLSRTVDFTDGMFAVDLSFGSAVFDGQALWLSIQVEGTDVACQPLRAAPYANTLRPKATINSDLASEEQLLHLRSGADTGGGEGVLGAKVGYRTSLGYPVGAYGYAYEYGSVGLWGASDSQFGWGVNGVADGTDSIGVRGIANAFTSTTYGVYGEANSPDGYAGYFEHTASSAPGKGLGATGALGAEITGNDGTGVLATASGDSQEYGDDGVRGVHSGGDGVVGESQGTGNLDNGVIGFSAGGYGIYGFSNGTGQYGGYFDDPISVNGGCTGCTTRYVARNGSDTTLRLGDVVRAAGVDTRVAGAQQPVILTAPAARGDNVLGVVVGKTTRTVVGDSTDQVQAGTHWGPTGGDAEPGDYVIVAVQGMAQVRVDPSASITAGDRIQFGEGGATRASSDPPFAMVLENASTRSGDGLVWALLGAP